MRDDMQPHAPQRLSDERLAPLSAVAGELDLATLVAAVERLLRRDLELERERLQGAERGGTW